MKRVAFLLVLLIGLGVTASAQLKANVEPLPSVGMSLMRPSNDGLLFGWFDPSRLTMRHSVSMSYMNFGGQGLSLGMYTNSMLYEFSDVLDLQADVSIMHSPFSSFGQQMQNELSGIYLTRAQLNYRPTENLWLQIQYRQVPPLYWLDGNRYNSLFYGFDRYDFPRR